MWKQVLVFLSLMGAWSRPGWALQPEQLASEQQPVQPEDSPAQVVATATATPARQ